MSRPLVYIDDEPALCRILSLRLVSQGVAVQTFTDPLEAIDYVNGHDVAVVLCDYRMPAMNGLDVLERLEEDVPFYLVTGDLALEPRADDFPRLRGVLRKPICFDEVGRLARGAGGPSEASQAKSASRTG